MIRKLSLRNFRGFHKFTVDFPAPAILVGANNAGKSTLIAALRLATSMLRYAHRYNASQTRSIESEEVKVYPFSSDQFDMQDENLRYEFRPVTTSMSLVVGNGSRLQAVWPKPPGQPYFYFLTSTGGVIEVAHAVRDFFPSIGTIPPLSPIDLREEELTEKWIQQNLSSRLASRHFRNQLVALAKTGQWKAFRDFVEKWTLGLRLEPPRVQRVDGQTSIDVYFNEGRGPKEVAWVGDGVQIFLQLLLHLFRLHGNKTIVLDEPEVYLHPDLQRRVLRVLESVTDQYIIATHSPEIVAEVDPENVVFVERTRQHSRRLVTSEAVAEASDALGSVFDLRLARALRTNVTLFVEGEDSVILRNLATTLGAQRLANENGITVTQLRGVSNWQLLRGLPWLTETLFEGVFAGYVLLDRDLMSELEREERLEQLRATGLHAHIWQRRELESYLIHPNAIARLVGLSPFELEAIIKEELDSLYPEIENQLIGARIQNPDRERRLHAKSIVEATRRELAATWTSLENKLTFCPAKPLISRINKRIQSLNGRSVSRKALSRHLLLEEVPEEIGRVLMSIEELIEEAFSPLTRH